MNIDPIDRDLARKRAREAAELDALLAEDYAAMFPTLDPSGYPIEPGDDAYLDAQARFLLGTSDEESA